ncbi:MAG: molybdopterin molybdotransferase MoeA [Kiloniellales bacterium]
MLSVAEARARILAAFTALPAETLALPQALGRVLAEDLAARVTQPPRAVSAMDGYAVIAADVAKVPVELEIVGQAPAGHPFGGRIAAGQTLRIFTGGELPEGADAIVIQEDTEVRGSRVLVREGAAKGRYVRPAGLDFKEGEVGLRAGRRLSARDIGFAASMNHPWLAVHRRPRVAVLATGDELALPGEPLGEGQILSSNGLSLAAFVTACGGEAVNLGIAPDERSALAGLARGARGADLLLTSGGVSVGDHDLVRSVLGDQGLAVDFWKVAMRPGKPLLFGRLGETPLLGLPGNPVSSLVCSLVFLRPLLDRLQGLAEAARPAETARLAAPLPANDKRQDYLRARLAAGADGSPVATAFGRQDSSMLATLAQANCLIVRAPEAPPAEAGARVEILRFDGGALPL